MFGGMFGGMFTNIFGGGDSEDLARAAARFGVRDRRVLAAMKQVDRRQFVPEGRRRSAYRDRPVRIPHGQTTSQPSLVAGMVEMLELDGDERVLEIGTGLGYQAALLSKLAGEVYTVERFAGLAETARANLEESGCDNVTVRSGDGSKGLSENAPFDGIVVSAAYPEVPDPLREQLREGGRLVAPLGPGGMERVVVFVKRGDDLEREHELTGASFVRLYGEHGYRE